jgi:hypothetical protein
VIDRNGIRPGSWQAVAWHAREFIREYWRALVIPLVILTLIVAAAIRLGSPVGTVPQSQAR